MTDALGWIRPGRLYRLVDREECSPRDFMSYEELGRPIPSDPGERLRLSWAGVSAFLTVKAAIARSNALRKDWYAVLEMTADRPVLAVLGRGQHVDLHAAPNVLLASVVEVLRCR